MLATPFLFSIVYLKIASLNMAPVWKVIPCKAQFRRCHERYIVFALSPCTSEATRYHLHTAYSTHSSDKRNTQL